MLAWTPSGLIAMKLHQSQLGYPRISRGWTAPEFEGWRGNGGAGADSGVKLTSAQRTTLCWIFPFEKKKAAGQLASGWKSVREKEFHKRLEFGGEKLRRRRGPQQEPRLGENSRPSPSFVRSHPVGWSSPVAGPRASLLQNTKSCCNRAEISPDNQLPVYWID